MDGGQRPARRPGGKDGIMRRRSLLLFALASLVLGTPGRPAAAGSTDLLVDATWLHARLGDPGIRLLDMTGDPQAYAQGHIPGAVHASLQDIRFPVPVGGYRLPTADELAPVLARLGIGPETHVVAYDDGSSLNAARLFFTLDVFGHPRISILDGGIESWRRAGFPLSREPGTVRPTTYRPSLLSDRVLSTEDLLKVLGDPGVALVDARSRVEYDGTAQMGKRGGHIPGAVHIEWRQHLQPDMTFKPVSELRALYAAHGVLPDKRVVTYCQTQHRGAHTYFVLRLLGYDQVGGYDRSWAEWGSRDDVPIER
jgi:thiosulfate/3-mercaptopyruvate sulfurtransferase